MSNDVETSRHGSIFEDEHEAYRESLREFLAREVAGDAEHEHTVDLASAARNAGAHGFVGLAVPDTYDGLGLDDLRFQVVRAQETIGVGLGGLGVSLGRHDDLVVPLLVRLGAELDDVADHLAAIAVGDRVTALIDDPAVEVRAVASGWTLHGVATSVVNGAAAGLLVVVLREERGTSLAIVHPDAAGCTRDSGAAFVGVSTADVADVRFDGTPVSSTAILGPAGSGRAALAPLVADERLTIAAGAVAAGRRALRLTLDYTRERRAFGQPIASFGNSRQMIGDAAAQLDVAEVFVASAIRDRLAGPANPRASAVAKLRAVAALETAVDHGVQLHGGYGYMLEYPISRAYADAALLAVHAGTAAELRSEIADAVDG